MKTCPKCRKRIDVQATKCPYCQTMFDGHQMDDGMRESSRGRWGKFWIFIALLAAGFIWLIMPGNVEKLAEATDKIDAEIAPAEQN